MFGFGSIFRKAQATVDNAIAQLVWGLLIAVPLLVALGYATAAVSTVLHRLYEPEIADLIVAGSYAAIAAVMGLIYVVRKPGAAAEAAPTADEQSAEATEEAAEAPFRSFSPAEREMLLSGLMTAAPLAIRPLLAALFRNLPIVLAIAVAGFILTRAASSEADMQPAAE
jgi:vacuolar-type H+-ATPase subunit I/STV1